MSMTEISKFNSTALCPKCGSDKFSIRFEEAPSADQDKRRRERLGWPTCEIIVSSCQICAFTKVSLPLDHQEAKGDSK